MSETISGFQQLYNNITLRIDAASDFLSGYQRLHSAALDDGTPEMIRGCYGDVLSAMEIVLDLKEQRKRIQLKSWGIDPDKRHLRFPSGESENEDQ